MEGCALHCNIGSEATRRGLARTSREVQCENIVRISAGVVRAEGGTKALSFAFRIAPEYGRLQITSGPRCNKPSGQTFISPRPVITPGASDEAHPCKDICACIVTSDLFSAGDGRNERFARVRRVGAPSP